MSGSGSALHSYLQVLAGGYDAGFLEIRFALDRGGMGQVFTSPRAIPRAARTIVALGHRTDVYVGATLRSRRAGGRNAVDRAHLVFVEIDSYDADRALAGFPHQPTLLIASGTPGHRHAYWRLSAPVAADILEDANRRLAMLLGADISSTDSTRVLRPPLTLNHKTNPPRDVELVNVLPHVRYPIDNLLADVPEQPRLHVVSPASEASVRPRRAIDDALRSIPAEEYAFALTGRRASRQGKIACPFHPDRNPSLQLYPDGTWFCFGCRHGGSIYDFAAAVWNTTTKSTDFLALRNRLANRFGVAPARTHA